MNILKKLLSTTIISILLLNNILGNVYAMQNTTNQTPINIAVFLLDPNEAFISRFKESLENIQKENENKVQFTFFDSKGNQSVENENIIKALDQDFNLFVIQPITSKIDELKDIFERITQKNIPFILLTSPNIKLSNFISGYPRTIIIGGDDEQSGILQGKTIADTWNANKEILDKNKDNIMQYVMIKGPIEYAATTARSKYSIQELNELGIKTQELSSSVCNWDKICARDTINAILLQYSNTIEVIIANSDGMAIGAIESLQKYGFNKGDPSKYIPVFGISGLPEVKELIEQGAMAGTVIQDPHDYANAVYTVGKNMILGINPLNGTNYNFDETGNTIRIPYYEYTK